MKKVELDIANIHTVRALHVYLAYKLNLPTYYGCLLYTSIIRRVTDNDYLFTIFTKILAVLIGLVASFYSNRFLGPQLKGELGRISSLLSIVAVTANFGLYQPYPYYKRQGEPDVLNQFLRIFLLQFIVYTVIGVILSLIHI